MFCKYEKNNNNNVYSKNAQKYYDEKIYKVWVMYGD